MMHASLGPKLSSCSATKVGPATSSKSSSSKPSSIRLSVDLDLSSEKNCVHFSVRKMILEQKKLRKKKENENNNNNKNNNNPFGEEDSDEEVARIAARFEEKYGAGLYDADGYIDKGEGYDENDPFVDNSEAYDELVPHNLTTEHDGFYINVGELKFKPIAVDQQQHDQDDRVDHDQFEKASLLQKLKRKRNKLEDDDDVIQVDGMKQRKNLGQHQKTQSTSSSKASSVVKQQQQRPTNLNTSNDDVQLLEVKTGHKKEHKIKNESAILAPAAQPTVTSSKVHHGQQNRVSSQGQGQPRKNSVPKTNTGNSVGSSSGIQQQQVENNPISVAQSIYNSKMQQMITDKLFGNLAEAAGINNTASGTSAVYTNSSGSLNTSLAMLRVSLLNAKVPYEIVSNIPYAKATNSDGHLSPDWKRYLLDIYKKTGGSSPKNRLKVFELIAQHMGVNAEYLYNLTQRFYMESSGAVSSSSGSSRNSSGKTTSSSGYQQQQQTSGKQPSTTPQAINLSTTAATASPPPVFSEGLAGKLIQHPNEKSGSKSVRQTTTTSEGTGGGSKLSAANPKANVPLIKMKQADYLQQSQSSQPQPHQYGMSNHGLAMLQSLASLAQSSSSSSGCVSTSLTTTTTSGGGGSNRMPPPQIPAPPSSNQMGIMGNNRTTPTPSPPPSQQSSPLLMPRNTAPNPNSLLAAFNSQTSPSSPKQSSVSPGSSAAAAAVNRPDLLSSFFQLPNMFTNANLISHFLNSPSAPPAARSTPSPNSSLIKSSLLNTGGGGGGGSSGSKTQSGYGVRESPSTLLASSSSSLINSGNQRSNNGKSTVISYGMNKSPSPTTTATGQNSSNNR